MKKELRQYRVVPPKGFVIDDSEEAQSSIKPPPGFVPDEPIDKKKVGSQNLSTSSNTQANTNLSLGGEKNQNVYDPVKSTLDPFRQQLQTAQTLFDPYRNRSVSDATRQNVLPVGVKNMQFGQSDFNQKKTGEKVASTNLQKAQVEVHRQLSNVKNAKDVLDDVKKNNGGVIPQDNETAQIAQKTSDSFDLANKDNRLVKLAASASNVKDFVKKFSATPITNDKELEEKTWDAMQDPNVEEAFRRSGKMNMYVRAANNFNDLFPNHAKQKISSQLAQWMDESNKGGGLVKSGYSKKDLDAQIEKQYKLGNISAVDRAFYYQNIKPSDVPTTADLNTFGRDYQYQMRNSFLGRALANVGLLEDPKEKYKYQATVDPKRVGGKTSGLLGQVSPMILENMALGGAGFSDKAANVISVIDQFGPHNQDRADELFPNDPAKKWAYTVLGTGVDLLTGELPIFKSGIFKKEAENLANIVADKTVNSSVKEQAKRTFLNKIENFVTSAAKNTAHGSAVLTTIPTMHKLLDIAANAPNAVQNLENTDFVGEFLNNAKAYSLLGGLQVGGKLLPEEKQQAEQQLQQSQPYTRIFDELPFEQKVINAIKQEGKMPAFMQEHLDKNPEAIIGELKDQVEQGMKGGVENHTGAIETMYGKTAVDLVKKQIQDEQSGQTNTTTPTTNETGAEVRDTKDEQAGVNTTDNGLQDGNSGSGKDVGGEKVELPNYGKTVNTKIGDVDLVIEPNEKSENKNSIQITAYNDEGKTVGVSSATINPAEKTLTIKVSQVKDEYQRKGIYSKIVDEYENIAKERGLTLIADEASQTKDSKAFWENRNKPTNEIPISTDKNKNEDVGGEKVEEFKPMMKPNGEPKVFYHSSDGDFTEIKNQDSEGYNRKHSLTNKGIYFHEAPPQMAQYGKNKYEAHLDIKNPFVIDSRNSYISDVVNPYTGKNIEVEHINADDIKFLKEQGYDAVMAKYPAFQTVVFDPSQVKLIKKNGEPIESKSTNEIPISTESQSNTIKEANTVEQPTSEGEKTSQPIENEPIRKSNEGQPPSKEPPVESVPSGEEKTTSIKNEQTKAERKERNLPEVEVEMRRKFGEVFQKGKEAVDKGEINPRALAKELTVKPRPLSAEENVALLYDRMRIMNEHQKVMDDIRKAIDKGDDVKASVLQSELARVEDEMNINDEAARKTGYEQGLGLAARKMMIKQDYSMANLMQRARVANDGKEVPQEVREKLKDLTQKLDEANKKIEDYEKQLAEAKLKREARSQKNKETVERLRQQRSKIKENIVSKWKNAGKDTLQASIPYAQQLMAIAPDVAKLVKNYAEEGFIELREIVDKIHSDLKDAIPEITKEDVSDIVLGKYDVEKMKATPSPEQIRMRANVEKIKKQINAEILKLKLGERNWWQKGVDWLHGWHRFSILSGVPTLGKIGMAAMNRGITTRVEDLIGGTLSKIPGVSSIAKGAERHSGFSSIKAEAKAFTTWFDKMTWQDIREIMKTGQSELDYLYGDKPEYIHAVPTWMDFFGRLHQAIKSLPKRAEFFRSLEIRTQKALKDGKNLSDPIVQQELAVAAYNDGLRQVFMNDNWVTNMYKDMLRGLQNAKNKDGSPVEGARLASDIMQFMFPIIKVPTNYVGEATSYLVGGLKAAVALRRGIKNMSPERRDYVMRMMKKQSIGAAFIAIGYLNPNMFGGYDSGKRKPDDLAAGDIELFGMKLPHWMSHTPLLEALQVGATIRRARDEAEAKRKPTNVLTGLHTVMSGISKQIPFISTGTQIGDATSSIDNAKKYFFRLGQSVVEPQLMQNVAGWTDKNAEGETIKRDPKTFVEQLETGVPALRKQVPEREGHNAELMKTPTFKYFYDKGFDLPNVSPNSVKIKDYKTSTEKSLSEYSKETQDEFYKRRWNYLKDYLDEASGNGVYVDQFGNVSLTGESDDSNLDYKLKSIRDLTSEETAKLLSIQGKRATAQVKKDMFSGED